MVPQLAVVKLPSQRQPGKNIFDLDPINLPINRESRRHNDNTSLFMKIFASLFTFLTYLLNGSSARLPLIIVFNNSASLNPDHRSGTQVRVRDARGTVNKKSLSCRMSAIGAMA
jgi:hypothetical protein